MTPDNRALLMGSLSSGIKQYRHIGSGTDFPRLAWLQPLTLYAASAAMLTRSESVVASCTICTGMSRPTSSGPITVAPPSSWSILVEIEAEWNAGMISTLAGPDNRQNGYTAIFSRLSATSGDISPSYSK